MKKEKTEKRQRSQADKIKKGERIETFKNFEGHQIGKFENLKTVRRRPVQERSRVCEGVAILETGDRVRVVFNGLEFYKIGSPFVFYSFELIKVKETPQAKEKRKTQEKEKGIKIDPAVYMVQNLKTYQKRKTDRELWHIGSGIYYKNGSPCLKVEEITAKEIPTKDRQLSAGKYDPTVDRYLRAERRRIWISPRILKSYKGAGIYVVDFYTFQEEGDHIIQKRPNRIKKLTKRQIAENWERFPKW